MEQRYVVLHFWSQTLTAPYRAPLKPVSLLQTSQNTKQRYCYHCLGTSAAFREVTTNVICFQETLGTLFGGCGTVANIKLLTDKSLKPYAFIQYEVR
jgi:hypothetical protein